MKKNIVLMGLIAIQAVNSLHAIANSEWERFPFGTTIPKYNLERIQRVATEKFIQEQVTSAQLSPEQELAVRLNIAVRTGNQEKVLELIDQGADINGENRARGVCGLGYSGAPLIVAIRNAQPAMVELLLDNGAHVDALHKLFVDRPWSISEKADYWFEFEETALACALVCYINACYHRIGDRYELQAAIITLLTKYGADIDHPSCQYVLKSLRSTPGNDELRNNIADEIYEAIFRPLLKMNFVD